MKTVDHMLILDVDGVISSLKDKKPNKVVLQHIFTELKKGMPVALNTGRSIEWVITRTGKPIIENPTLKKTLHNFIIVGEKGGTWMTFDENGKSQEYIDESISISPKLQKNIKRIVKKEYSESMFYDISKKTMISTEMKDGYNMKKYLEDQNLLIPIIDSLIKKYGLEKILVMEPNPIALDVQNEHVGKHLGVKRILNWLRAEKIKVSNFTTIGDSKSDIKMAEELNRNNLSVIHVHVGKKGVHEISYPFEVITTEKEYDEGAGEFLSELREEN